MKANSKNLEQKYIRSADQYIGQAHTLSRKEMHDWIRRTTHRTEPQVNMKCQKLIRLQVRFRPSVHNRVLHIQLDIYGRALDPNRQRSESYSPYEPPQQIDYHQQPSRVAQSYRNQLGRLRILMDRISQEC